VKFVIPPARHVRILQVNVQNAMKIPGNLMAMDSVCARVASLSSRATVRILNVPLLMLIVLHVIFCWVLVDSNADHVQEITEYWLIILVNVKQDTMIMVECVLHVVVGARVVPVLQHVLNVPSNRTTTWTEHVHAQREPI
jgi:hypothetical protein